MKRQDLLKISLQKEENVDATITKALKNDKKFVDRKVREFQDQVEDLETNLEERLSSSIALDVSTIENVFGQIQTLNEKVGLYKKFTEKYL